MQNTETKMRLETRKLSVMMRPASPADNEEMITRINVLKFTVGVDLDGFLLELVE